MPWVEALTDTQDLRRCIRDLVALSTLPAIWKNYQPQQIADSIAAALLSMLAADFVYLAFPGDKGDESLTEVIHIGKQIAPGSAGIIRTTLRDTWLGRSEQTGVIANPMGEGTIRVAAAPIGFRGNAVVVAGSRQPGFPVDAQRLLLSIGANNTTIALQRLNAEAEERRFLSLVERSSDFVGIAGLNGSPHYINPAGLRLVGLATIEQASRLHILDFLAPAERSRAHDECWPAVMRTGRWRGELRFRHFKTGADVFFLVDWFRIDHPRTGRPMNIATVSRDLSAQKRSEAELHHLNETLEQRVAERAGELAWANEKLRTEIAERERADVRLQELQLELFHAARLSTAGQMAAALAHELNQPLTAATNSIHAARRLLKDAPGRLDTVRVILDEASEQTQRGGQIIHRLRDFVARGETEKQIESLPILIKEASSLALTGSGASGVQVSLQFDPKGSEIIADRIQVGQVLINLIRNAAEAMAGMRRRELAVTTTCVDSETVEIAVADRGPGLPKEMAGHLFQPFVSTKRDGMGLGLIICRSIVEAHGGRLWNEPNPGGGTIFRFTLASGLTIGELNVG
jgi:two-component system, LuxR family, sensor kinase FixL